jgi:adenylyltransferase/sulfurtransferase
VGYHEALTSENALAIIKDYDVICDGTDNFPTRYLANDACVILKKPYIYGSILRFEGQASVFNLTEESPNYRDLVPEPPPPGLVPSCAEGGVIGVLPGLVGTIQATEAIKVITGAGKPLDGRILLIDALGMKFRQLRLSKNYRNKITKLIDYEQFCNPAKQERDRQEIESIDVIELKERLNSNKENTILIDIRNKQERDICLIEDAIHIPQKDIESEKGLEKIKSFCKDRDIYIHCKTGGRSRNTTELLRTNKIKAINVTGGILEWIEKIDSSLNKY